MVKDFKEKEIIISFTKAFSKPTTKRAKSALKLLKDKVRKETRENTIKINNSVNEALWERGLFKAQRKIKLKIIKEKVGVRVYLPKDKIIEIKKETTKKEEKTKKPENAEEKDSKNTKDEETNTKKYDDKQKPEETNKKEAEKTKVKIEKTKENPVTKK